jgi:hypothetical protein
MNYMDGDSIVELVTLWLKEFYESKNLVFYPSVYPFKESQLRELAKYKPTVRQILQWCAKYFQVPGTPSTSDNNSKQTVSQPHSVEVAFNKELVTVEGTIDTLLEDKAALADALRLGFNAIIKLKQTIETVEIKRIEEAEPKGENKGYIDFKIVGKENGKIFKIGVAVLQQSYGGSLAAGLRRLIAYRTFGLTRGCLVRSEEKVISPTATLAQDYLSKLLSPKGRGKWVPLKVEAIKPLLAIRSVFLGREDYELSEEQIFDFIAHQKKLTVENYLIREILNVPVDQVTTQDEKSSQVIDQDKKASLSKSSDKCEKQLNSDLGWIQEIAKVGNSSDGHAFEKLVRRGLLKLGFSGSGLNPDSTGGAGGIDFHCEFPYPIIGECKATKTEKVPDGTPAQLHKIGMNHLGKANYERSIKLIVAAGELTAYALRTATEHEMNVIRPETLQRLVEVQARYRGSVDLIELKKECLQQPPFGLANDKFNSYIDKYINKVKQDIKLRSHLVNVLKKYQEEKELEAVGFERICGVYDNSNPLKSLTDKEMHEILIELSSPLTGYLGRIKGSDWQRDRFYFLRDLQIN